MSVDSARRRLGHQSRLRPRQPAPPSVPHPCHWARGSGGLLPPSPIPHPDSRSSISTTGKNDADWTLKLFVSADGVSYDFVTRLDVPGRPNETTLRVLPDGEMIALVRREAGDASGWIGASRLPYTRWSWTGTKHRLGGPNFLRLPDGSLWAAGWSYPRGAKTILARMSRASYEPVLTLPSGGDTSYPGLVWHDGLLWVSYYSSHEGKAAIYLAMIKVPLAAEPIAARVEPFVDDSLLDHLGGSAPLEVKRPMPQEVVLPLVSPESSSSLALRASVGSTEASNGRLARVGVVGPKRATLLSLPIIRNGRRPTRREGVCAHPDASRCVHYPSIEV